MKIAGNRQFAAPQAAVEAVLQDGHRLAQAAAGFHLTVPLDNQHQRGTLTVAVGPLQGQYETTFAVTQSAAGREISFDGHSNRGIFQGYGRIHLTPNNEQTILHYEGDIDVTGPLASLPPRLLQANINAIIRRFLDGIEPVLWPERFAIEPELESEMPLWLKTVVPAVLIAISILLLIRIIGKRFK